MKNFIEKLFESLSSPRFIVFALTFGFIGIFLTSDHDVSPLIPFMLPMIPIIAGVSLQQKKSKEQEIRQKAAIDEIHSTKEQVTEVVNSTAEGNQNLQTLVENLISEVKTLKEENAKLVNTNESLVETNKTLVVEIEELKKRIEKVSKENIELRRLISSAAEREGK